MGNSTSAREYEAVAALFAAMLVAGLIGGFAPALLPYALGLSLAWLAVLLWRRRATPRDFAVRFGVASLALALLFILLRQSGFGWHAAA